ncbi:MAG: SCO family protein [Pirellulaceae bacterium]
MKTFIHIVIILVVGVGLGLTVRNFRTPQAPESAAVGDSVAASGSDEADTPDEDQDAGRPTRIEPPPKFQLDPGDDWLQSFELTERSGEQIASEDLVGQPYIVSFFFSTCPSICVMQNQKLQELQKEFKGKGVRFLSITVDPENDTPEALTEYAARFGADSEQWLFLTGDLNYIRRVGAEMYQVPVDKAAHTERLILVNPEGDIDGLYSWNDRRSFERLKKDISKMLSDTAQQRGA